MTSNINGLNQSTLDFQANKKEPEWMQNLNGEEYKTAKYIYDKTSEGIDEANKSGLSLNGLSQSGYSADGKITIWGKYLGYDKTISSNELHDLRNFIDQTTVKMPGFGFSDAKNGAFIDSDILSLIDSADLSIDEFKQKYTQANEKLQEKINNMGKELITQDNISNKPFNPIQSLSKNTQTYDINKDTKFAYRRELLKREQERGIDVLHLMQKLEENGEKVVDKII